MPKHMRDVTARRPLCLRIFHNGLHNEGGKKWTKGVSLLKIATSLVFLKLSLNNLTTEVIHYP